MYSIQAEVEGVAALLQHRYVMKDPDRQTSGEKDYSAEWQEYFYVDNDNEVIQPAGHFDAAMVKAAANFKIPGRRGKTFKDLFKGNVFCFPDQIPHGIQRPAELDTDSEKNLYLDIRPVVVQRARVARIRPAFKAGWKLAFEIQVLDDQIPAVVVNEVLTMAGRTIGIGDFRPKFGRFIVVRFEIS